MSVAEYIHKSSLYIFCLGVSLIFISAAFSVDSSVLVVKNAYIVLLALLTLTFLSVVMTVKGRVPVQNMFVQGPVVLIVYFFIFLSASAISVHYKGGNIYNELHFLFKPLSLLTLSSLLVLSLCAANVVHGRKRIILFYLSLIITADIVFSLDLLNIFVHEVFSDGITLVGSSFNMSIFAGFCLLLSILLVDIRRSGSHVIFLVTPTILLSFVFLFLYPHRPVLIVLTLLLGTTLIFCITQYYASRTEKEGARRFPVAMLIVFCALVVSLASNGFYQAIAINDTAEVRPSLTLSLEVAYNSYTAGGLSTALLGSGVGLFSEVWNLHKPVSVNSTPLALADFDSGFGFVSDLIVSTGVLGLSAFLMLTAYVFIFVVRRIAYALKYDRDYSLDVISLVLFTYLLVWLVVYTPSIPVLALTFILIGLSIARRQALIPVYRPHAGSSLARRLAVHVLGMLLLIVTLIGLFVISNAAFSAFAYMKGIAYVEVGQSDKALIELEKATERSDHPLYYRSLSQVRQREINVLLSSSEELTEKETIVFNDLANQAIDDAEAATTLGPHDYQNWIVLGNVYLQLATIGVDGAYGKGRSAYNRAEELSPVNPLPPYLKARLAAAEGNTDETLTELRKSLSLKDDYEPALILQNSLSEEVSP